MHLARVPTLVQAEDNDAASGWVDRPVSGDVASLRSRLLPVTHDGQLSGVSSGRGCVVRDHRPSSETRRPCGIRVDAAMLPSVFHLFPQASASIELIQHVQGGLGIERTLVRSRLEKQGGSNTAHSAGRGQHDLFTG